eukprot:TRINITY_DN44259_c0_g1_i1.p1 TRINITY_DN44259_c0_g1~~TRINITY_DN44259_c0_g1_i1.p1  ORF type:complete len:204 (-),score=25.97 TRINITY_DN44259_c0_g1_i1:25-636(-)
MGADEGGNGQVAVSVHSISGALVASQVTVSRQQSVAELKMAIAEAGGPPPSDQQLIAGHRILEDRELSGEALDESGGMIFLVTVAGCPTCQGPCACTLCGCVPQHGLIDYYGLCRECGKCGGHSSACPFCRLSFPSLCALDTHVRFAHQDREFSEWQSSRLEDHLKKRDVPGARLASMPEHGTFMEACRGGIGSETDLVHRTF